MALLVLQGSNLTAEKAKHITVSLNGQLHIAGQFATINTAALSEVDVHALRQRYTFDINQIPDTFKHDKAALLVTDMDSTLINIECIDEIADFMNLKPRVAEITQAAMRGEINFETSLRKRVSLLKGLDVSVLQRVYDERLRLNPGAQVLVNELKQRGIKLALVSGGFTFFTDRLTQRLGLDFSQANKLAVHQGRLVGEIEGDICGAQAKANFLHRCCESMNVLPTQAVAVGDGANDLLMMKSAGLSVAYYAKPKVQRAADTVINYNGLDAIISLLQIDFDR